MHIPDGYLSPETCGVMGAAMVPVWTTAGRRVRSRLGSQLVPHLALGAAFSFLVMMFNIPIPDGTTAHGVAATLVAVLLGPWAAVVSVSTALVIQAVFFGDGGVLALGANCWNMAFVGPFVGYGVYRLMAGRQALDAPRRALAAGVGGYVGLNVAALFAAVEFGLQPTLFTAKDGTPLYAPFHLSQTVPAMALAHLTVAGLVEFVLTFGVVRYLQRANPALLRVNPVNDPGAGPAAPDRPGWRTPALVLLGLAALTPLGLLAPGGAFGEDSPNDLDLRHYGLRSVPVGLNRWSGFWSHAVLNGYGFHNGDHPVVAYLLSAFIGLLAIAALVAAVRFLVAGRSRKAEPAVR